MSRHPGPVTGFVAVHGLTAAIQTQQLILILILRDIFWRKGGTVSCIATKIDKTKPVWSGFIMNLSLRKLRAKFWVRDPRVTGAFRWEGTSEDLQSKPQIRLLQVNLENLKGWRVHRCPGQPVPLCGSPQGKRKFLLLSGPNLSRFSLWLLFLLFPLSTSRKILAAPSC